LGCMSLAHMRMLAHMPARLSVASCTNHIIPEIASPISGLTQNTVQFMKGLDDYFHCKSVGDSLKLPRVTKAITDKFVKIWLMATKANIHSYEEDFKVSFLNQFWDQVLQSHTRAHINRCKHD
jgi:hypothetical protein